uniref:Secreted protein n=1 Tax=Rhipicephalus appendiculatus TaxID=34631 RepID=A0A131YE41_RHIAP
MHPLSCIWLSSLPLLSLSLGFLTRKLTDYILKADIFLLHVISNDVMVTIKAQPISCFVMYDDFYIQPLGYYGRRRPVVFAPPYLDAINFIECSGSTVL